MGTKTQSTSKLKAESAIKKVTVVAESSSSSYTPNFESGDFFEYTIDQDVALFNPLNTIRGYTGKIIIKQDATGGHDVAFGTNYIFTNTALINTAPSAYTTFNFTVISDKHIVMEQLIEFDSVSEILVSETPDQSILYDSSNIITEFIA